MLAEAHGCGSQEEWAKLHSQAAHQLGEWSGVNELLDDEPGCRQVEAIPAD
jgi:hypothetical protein